MTTHPDRLELVESVTLRANGRKVTVDNAVVDTGTDRTEITEAIVAALGLETIRIEMVGFGGESVARATIHRCVVAWTIYESQGYWSELEVRCMDGMKEVLIGFDFLSRHDLTVDTQHHGLVGHAPSNAVPMMGGGYMLNAPKAWIAKQNSERFERAKPGEILRPHPAWRFTVPAVTKG